MDITRRQFLGLGAGLVGLATGCQTLKGEKPSLVSTKGKAQQLSLNLSQKKSGNASIDYSGSFESFGKYTILATVTLDDMDYQIRLELPPEKSSDEPELSIEISKSGKDLMYFTDEGLDGIIDRAAKHPVANEEELRYSANGYFITKLSDDGRTIIESKFRQVGPERFQKIYDNTLDILLSLYE